MAAWTILFGVLLFSIALFLILLVLVQRGRGGGLSGALGGMGGQSAFGTKAGDLFTRITIVVATVWILLCIGAILVLNPQRSSAGRGGGEGVDYRTPAVEGRGGKPAAEDAKSEAAKAAMPESGGVGGVGSIEAESPPAGESKDAGESAGSAESKK